MKIPRLREWRETRGETQVSLAEKVGVTQYTVLRAEHGENTRPTTARRFAEALGVSVSDLQETPPIPQGFAEAGKAEAPNTGRPSRYAGYLCYHTPYKEPGFGSSFDYDDQLENAVEAMRGIRRLVDEAIGAGHDQLEYARVILTDDLGELRVAVQIPYQSKAEMEATWEALGFPTDGTGDYAPDLFAPEQYLYRH
jgi:transcriptional regulator with XRE-family HTH domain